MEHAIVAFNANQVDTILRSVSNETITSSLYQMQNMLEAAIRVGVRSQGGSSGQGCQRINCSRKQSEGSEAESRESDNGTEGYTILALSSDDEIVVFSNRKAKETGSIILSSPTLPDLLQPLTAHPDPKLLVKDFAQMTMSLWPT